MGRAISAPSASDGDENFRKFLHKRGLLFRRQHEISVALRGSGKRGENSSTHAKVRLPHMRTLFGSLEAESNPAEIVNSHITDFGTCSY